MLLSKSCLQTDNQNDSFQDKISPFKPGGQCLQVTRNYYGKEDIKTQNLNEPCFPFLGRSLCLHLTARCKVPGDACVRNEWNQLRHIGTCPGSFLILMWLFVSTLHSLNWVKSENGCSGEYLLQSDLYTWGWQRPSGH